MLDTEKEIARVIDEALPELKELAISVLKKKIEVRKLVFTEDLFNSFRTSLLNSAADLQREIIVAFNLYGRYKDMKFVEYERYNAPVNNGKRYSKTGDEYVVDEPLIVHEMRTLIMKVGLSKFKYIPGYTTNGSNRMPITTRAITRLAWTLASARMRNVRVPNKRKGWYNESRGFITNKAAAMLRKRISMVAEKTITDHIKGLDVVVKI